MFLMLSMQRQLRRRKRAMVSTSAAADLLAAATVAHMSLLPLPEPIPLPDTIASPHIVLRQELGKSHALHDKNVCRRVQTRTSAIDCIYRCTHPSRICPSIDLFPNTTRQHHACFTIWIAPAHAHSFLYMHAQHIYNI